MTIVDIHPDEINALVHADHGAPGRLLGCHKYDEGSIIIRALRPDVAALYVVLDNEDTRHEMKKLHDGGLFELVLTATPDTQYHYVGVKSSDKEITFHDPYNAPPLWDDTNLYLFGEGNYRHVYEKMGAHVREVNGVTGVNFALWAPNARRVSVVGNFNNWDERMHPMHLHETGGIWEIFIPGIGPGDVYKYSLKSNVRGYRAEKSDPYGFAAELRPATASIIADIDNYDWNDDTWMAMRATKDMLKQPIAIYEVHLGSWKRHDDGSWLSYRELAGELAQYCKEMGYTHIELMPVAEHPFDGSWGYQVTGYFAPTSRFGTPEDFMYFVDYMHQQNIGVILDWVPAHFPKDGHALSFFDGTHLYSHEDPRQGEHPDWGTYIFNYGRDEVRNFLISNALFWLKKYHIDGLRVDAVSSMVYLDFSREGGEWIPNKYGGRENLDAVRFLQETNQIVHEEFPGAMTIAEESTSWPMVSRPTYLGGLGFTLKWNMGWMHDTLKFMQLDPIYRRFHHHQLTFAMIYAYTENFVLSLSHDEVVHGKGSLIGKMFGDWWQKFASVRLLWGYQYTSVGKKLNFMGSDIGQWNEWNDAGNIEWNLLELPTHRGLQDWVRDLNEFYRSEPALWEVDFDEAGFRWIEANDTEQNVYSWARFAEDSSEFLVIACNFTPVPRHNYRIGVPEAGYYEEKLNSDSEWYGGGNVGNNGGCQTDPTPWHGFDHSMNITVPPLGIVILKKRGDSPEETGQVSK